MSHQSAATALGFGYLEKGDAEFLGAWNVLPEVSKSGTIKHVLFGEVAGVEATAFQHSTVIQTGQVPITVYRSIYTCEIPFTPWTFIKARGGPSRLLRTLGFSKGASTGDPGFDAMWRVVCEDERFVTSLLNESLRRHVASKRTVTWRLLDGRLCLVYSGKMREELMGRSFERLARFRELAEPALDALGDSA